MPVVSVLVLGLALAAHTPLKWLPAESILFTKLCEAVHVLIQGEGCNDTNIYSSALQQQL
jgi:hypothetical protein